MKIPLIIRDEPMRAGVCRMIAGLDLSKPWAVKIYPYKKNRTLNQNDLMWVYNTEIANHTGHTPNEIHEHCKGQFLSPRTVTVNGKTTEYRTTTTLNTAEMSEYLERVRAWAHVDLGVTLSAYHDETNKETTT